MSVDSSIELVSPLAAPIRVTASAPVRRTPLRILARDGGIVVALLLITELLLQLIAPQYGHDYYDRVTTASQPVTFNADGYRGPAVPLAKQPGEFRILALGDSTTFGTGVAIENTWPLQLQKSLAEARPDRPVTAMNVALQGASLAEMTAAYEQRWAAYHPDAVTVLVSSNMIALAWIHRDRAADVPPYIFHQLPPLSAREMLSRQIGRLCLPHFLSVNSQRVLYWLGVIDHHIAIPQQPYGAMLAHGWRQSDLPTDEADTAWQCFAHELQGLRTAAANHGAKLIVGFSPCRFDLTDTFFDNEKNVPRHRLTIDPADRLRQLCAAQHIDTIDVPAELRSGRQRLTEARGHEAPMYIMFDYNHLDPDGHAAVANAMLSELSAASR